MCTREFIPPEECAAYVGTCDGGDCDRTTVALVMDSKGEWLSLCEYHGASALVTQAPGVRAVKG